MRKVLYGVIGIAFIVSLVACSTKNQTGNQKTTDLSLTWELKENFYQKKYQSRSEFVLSNGGSELIEANWELYFNLVRTLIKDSLTPTTGNVSIFHVNGDLFKLIPNQNFSLPAGESVSIAFTTSDWMINTSDAPAGPYIVFTDKDGVEGAPSLLENYEVKPFITKAQTTRSPEDNLPVPTPLSRFEENAYISKLDETSLPPFLPAPVEFSRSTSSITFSPEFSIVIQDKALEKDAAYLANSLKEIFGKPLATFSSKKISLALGNVSVKGKVYSSGANAYSLRVSENLIQVVGTDLDGVFYGIQSLRLLIPASHWGGGASSVAVEKITIADKPRFSYRGMHLDVARNFQSKAQVLKLLDLMALYKLNKFHFHLSDDEGWRVELPELPELTEIGAKRGHDKLGKGLLPSFGSGPYNDAAISPGSGFYTKATFIELVKYANERHIEVIPEIDGPGHIRAAIKAMDVRHEHYLAMGKKEEGERYLLRDLNDSSVYRSVQLWNDNVVCPCQEGTYNFMDRVVQSFVQLYKEAGVELKTFHIGGDEVPEGVWEKSPSCIAMMKAAPAKFGNAHEFYHYFVERNNAILQKYQLNTAGWEEVFTRKSTKKTGPRFEAKPELALSSNLAYVWNNIWGWGTEDNAYILANAGQKVVLGCATNLYFDLAYNKDPEEPGYYWATHCDLRKPFEFIPLDIYKSAVISRMGDKMESNKVAAGKVALTKKGKENIVGLQGHLWSENTKSAMIMDHLIFPRLIALAQRAWVESPSWSTVEDDSKRSSLIDADYSIFLNTLALKELPRLDYLHKGVGYALPLPGAKLEGGKLIANSIYPSFIIRYTTDGTEPTIDSKRYEGPVEVGGTIKLKLFAPSGRSSRTSVIK